MESQPITRPRSTRAATALALAWARTATSSAVAARREAALVDAADHDRRVEPGAAQQREPGR